MSSKISFNINSWGTISEISNNKSTATLLMGSPELHRLFMNLKENEEKKTKPKQEVIDALNVLEKYSFNSSVDIEAKVPMDKRIIL